jgi:ferredoxin
LKVAVIGSGLSAFAAVNVLEKNNIKPTVYDVGVDCKLNLKKIKKEILNLLNNSKKDRFTNFLKYTKAKKSEFPRKNFFGSSHIHNKECYNGLVKKPASSNAFGGFSNVWSASALIPDPEDMVNWPEGTKNFDKKTLDYFKDIPYVANDDNLSLKFKHLKKNFTKKVSNFESVKFNFDEINSKNLLSGYPRTLTSENNCIECGLCMTGCLFNVVFNSKDEFEKLIKKNKINYHNNHEVVKIFNDKKGISIIFKNGKIHKNFDKIFLATGSINSIKILKNSINFKKKLFLKYASGILIPFFSFKSVEFNWPNTDTFSKLFIEIKNKDLQKWTHCQLSQANEFVLNLIGYKRLYKFFSLIYDFFLRRFFVLTCVIHSNYNNKLSIENDSKNKNLKFKLLKNKNTIYFYKSIFKTISTQFRKIGIYTSKLFVNFNIKQDIYYTGSTFPMKGKVYKENQTNIYGELKQIKNLHIIDSSIFPSIPATTFGLLIMLNATRIVNSVIKIKKK